MSPMRWILVLLGAPSSLQAACNANLVEAAPSARYSIEAPGPVGENVVVDLDTGLVWKQCVEGLSGADCGTGTITLTDWSGALALAQSETFAGFDDWRLPNVLELSSLIETACHAPAHNQTVFPGMTDGMLWAATARDADAAHAWVLDVGSGMLAAADKSGLPKAARLVRGGAADADELDSGAAPNAFAFAAQNGVPRSSVRVSAAAALVGLAVPTWVRAGGAVGTEYSIDGGSFTIGPGIVAPGASLRLRHTSAATFATTVTSTLNVGGMIASFSSSTEVDPSTTEIVSLLPTPSVVDQTTTLTARVSGTASAPADGQLVVTASTGESCTDSDGPSADSGNAVLFSCSLVFASTGARTVSANYSGSATHGSSSSGDLGHAVDLQPTQSSVVEAQPNPSQVGQQVVVSVRVLGALSAPEDGEVVVTASTGESCSDTDGPTPESDTAAGFSCSLAFATVGTRNLSANFGASSTHASSTSSTLEQVVEPTVNEIFSNGFEPLPPEP